MSVGVAADLGQLTEVPLVGACGEQPQHPAAADEAEAVPGKTESEDPWSGLLPN